MRSTRSFWRSRSSGESASISSIKVTSTSASNGEIGGARAARSSGADGNTCGA